MFPKTSQAGGKSSVRGLHNTPSSRMKDPGDGEGEWDGGVVVVVIMNE